MKLLIAYLRPESLTTVKKALAAVKIHAMSVTNILGAGRQRDDAEMYRGVQVEVSLLKKVRVEIALPDDKVRLAMEAITQAARTGKEGDGVILVHSLDHALRVRTGEEGL